MNTILILDLDNTILSDKEHPNLLVQRLKLLRIHGKIILATGRNFQNFITSFNWNDISNLIDVGIFQMVEKLLRSTISNVHILIN